MNVLCKSIVIFGVVLGCASAAEFQPIPTTWDVEFMLIPTQSDARIILLDMPRGHGVRYSAMGGWWLSAAVPQARDNWGTAALCPSQWESH